MKKFADFVKTQLTDGSPQFKRQYLRAVINKIIVHENSIKIIYRSNEMLKLRR